MDLNKIGFDTSRKKVPAVILVTDVRGFTRLCGQRPIETVGRFIDEFITVMKAPVFKIRDTIRGIRLEQIGFLGDGLFVIFTGAEIASQNVSLAVVRAALEIREKFNELAKSKRFNVGIGLSINRGDILCGYFGHPCGKCPSDWKGVYTGIGPMINETFRMLSLAQKSQILVTRKIWADVVDEMVGVEMDYLLLKGVDRPITPYWIQREITPFDKKTGSDQILYRQCCEHCRNFKYCRHNWELAAALITRNPFFRPTTRAKMECDRRTAQDRAAYCDGCPKNETSCFLNVIRAEDGLPRTCCDDCPNYGECAFHFQNGKFRQPVRCCSKCGQFYKGELCDWTEGDFYANWG